MKVREVSAGDRHSWLAMRKKLWPGSDDDHTKETSAHFEGGKLLRPRGLFWLWRSLASFSGSPRSRFALTRRAASPRTSATSRVGSWRVSLAGRALARHSWPRPKTGRKNRAALSLPPTPKTTTS